MEKKKNTNRVTSAMKEQWVMAQSVALSQSAGIKMTMISFGMLAKVNACFCQHDKMKPATNYGMIEWFEV